MYIPGKCLGVAQVIANAGASSVSDLQALSWAYQGRIIAPVRRRSNAMNRAIITLLGLGLLAPVGLGAARYSDIYPSNHVHLAKPPKGDSSASPDDPKIGRAHV